MELYEGEEFSLEIGEYHFEFTGPITVTEDDIQRLRNLAKVEDEIRARNKKQRSKQIGF